MHRVAIVVFEGVQVLDVAGPAEVFHQVARLAPPGYRVDLVGRTATTSGGMTLAPVHALDSAVAGEPIDTLVVAGGSGVREAERDEALLAFVREAAGRSRRIASVCSGAFVLARAGLLDGRRATTHWGWCDALARRHPLVTVEPDPIFVKDGDVYTSAGVTAGMDLALTLVEEDHGADVALEVARSLVLFARRPGGQAQFSAQLAAQAATHAPLQAIQAWIAEHPEADLSVGALAARAHMSPRSFARAFAREVGQTPAAYVESVRVEQARSRLEATDAPLATVARACGFGTPETMRRAFHRRLGVAPADYRMRFPTRPRRH